MATPPKCPRPEPLPPAEIQYHERRKRIHLLCFAIFVALPFLNLMRVDIPRQLFYFLGFELSISEFGILFFTLMFLMFCVAASAIIHGRIYCSYACPQMIFSEWSQSVEGWAKKIVNRQNPKAPAATKQVAVNVIFYSILALASVFLAFVFTSYFVEPRDLLNRLLHFDLRTAGGLTGAVVTLITFLDFTLVRQKFCTTVCPYGYLQGMLQDQHTLLVAYRDGEGSAKACIECKKCVRVCEMGIDIRKSPFQIECVHCGDCIDACEDVLRKLGKPGLIQYSWGEKGLAAGAREAWYQRLGFRDAKRVVLALILLFYFSGLTVALSMRRSVAVRAAADRTVLYKVLENGQVVNRIRLNLANRAGKAASVAVRVEGLPNAELALDQNPIPLAAGETVERVFDLRVRPWAGSSDVNHFRLIAQPSTETSPESFEITFILPVAKPGGAK